MTLEVPAGLVLADSNIWIDWLIGNAAGRSFEPLFAGGKLLVPSLLTYEVTRWFLVRTSEETSQIAGLQLGRWQRCAIDDVIAVEAAQLAKRYRLAMADAMLLACAQAHDAEMWTQDADFAGLPGVRLFERQR